MSADAWQIGRCSALRRGGLNIGGMPNSTSVSANRHDRALNDFRENDFGLNTFAFPWIRFASVAFYSAAVHLHGINRQWVRLQQSEDGGGDTGDVGIRQRAGECATARCFAADASDIYRSSSAFGIRIGTGRAAICLSTSSDYRDSSRATFG